MNCYEINITYKKNRAKMQCINSSVKVFKIMKSIKDFRDNIDYIEMAYAIYLDGNCNILGVLKLSEGSVSNCSMDPRRVFQGAILSNASGFILVHNHPSGNLKFSEQDRRVYKSFEQRGELMDIKLVDFLIVTEDDCLSIMN